jgi:hypothetical protein
MAKKTYTAKEKKAYHMGRAYAAAKAGKRVKISDEKQKQSFRNGVNAVRGKGVKRKGKVPKGSYYLVDGNGVIVGVASGKK